MKAKSILFLVPIFFLITNSFAQVEGQGILKDMYGQAFSTKEYVDIVGSPFLNEDWKTGEVKIQNETVFYKDMDLKYDLVKDIVLFKNDKGEALLFAKPVSEFKIPDENNSSVLHFILLKEPKYNKEGFYQIISDGKTKLLKKPVKKIVEKSEYASANKIRNFELINSYYILKDNVLINVKKDKKSILAVLSDQNSVEKYADDNKLNFKNDIDLIKIVSFYNSIK